ncbi:GNAT family N-acetyltransferase [Micromonospora sonneratiae]
MLRAAGQGWPPPVRALKADLEKGDNDYATLARDNETAAGLASYTFLWPAVGLTRSLYLKEPYVSKTHRRRGIGTLLMSILATIAAENRCSRLEWTTDTDKRQGAEVLRLPWIRSALHEGCLP